MTMQPTRTFSFDADDERTLSSNMTERLHSRSRPQSYHDSPSRDIISPPPEYISPPDSPLPASPTRALYPTSSRISQRYSQSLREAQREEYFDDLPPPPPPHRSSDDRSNRTSVGQRSLATGLTSREEQSEIPGSDQVVRNPRLSEAEIKTSLVTQPPALPHAYTTDHTYAPNAYFQRPSSRLPDHTSYSSNIPLTAGAATPGSITPIGTPDVRSSHYSGRSIPLEDYSSPYNSHMAPYYSDSPYHNSSLNFDNTISDASINPHNIADDGDDGFLPEPKRKSGVALSRSRSRGPAVTAGTVATAGGALGGLFARAGRDQTASGNYGPVDGPAAEKSGWLAKQKTGSRRMRWVVGVAIGTVIVLAIVAGIVGGVLGSHQAQGGSSGSGSGNTNNANDDTAANGDLDLNSAEIKKLMNNPNLHKVFPGMDYTPWGVQYPLCLTYPPSQNNVTRDMAVLSQLTNTVRLYGTDCNQTEMVLHAIDRLQLKSMKVWLGVWVDTNTTTTDRQISQMYKILEDTKDKSIFKGAIIGNEALYRAGEDKAQSKQELITLLTNTRSNFTQLGYNLPIATSDLGDNWDSDLVAVSDYVMSNIHPFFAGVTAEEGASWTWEFWQNHDVPLTANTNVKQIISETGWPSGGGTDCGGTTGACASGQSGAVASVANMNTFMANWVCQALQNGTDYFWFEGFDEPWKIQYNTATQAWEDKWGLMDSARNLKPGLKIPSCGGQTAS